MYRAILIGVLFLYALRMYWPKGRFGASVATAALLLHGGYIFQRGFSLGRLPLLGMHDTILFYALCTGGFAIIVE